jgi:hypothetical protein
MSVTGLIVALGLLVDAAIVMTDEVGKRVSAGMARLQAVSEAVRRLFMPLFASTVTTILSFLPLLLLPGPAGDFVGSIAIAVVVMLIWSFVIAVTITPAVSGWWLRAGDGAARREGILMRGFRLTLRSGLAIRCGRGARLVLPVTRLPRAAHADAAVLPRRPTATSSISRSTCPKARPWPKPAAWPRIDARLRAEEDVRSATWVLGRSAPGFYYNLVGNRDQAPGFAQALVTPPRRMPPRGCWWTFRRPCRPPSRRRAS